MTEHSKRKSILIVDDLPGNLETLGELLHENYRVLAAASGEQALAVAARDPVPDLILLDIMMPGIDGYAVLARLHADPLTRDIPVLFVTALGDDADEERGLRLGAADYIAKPLRPAVVLARVATHLALAEARQRLANRNRDLEALVAERTADLEEARRVAEAASRAKSAFLANMSHELRTPLNAIIGHAQLLENADGLPAKQHRAAETIRSSGEHLLAMVDDILDLTRIEARAIDAAPSPCDLRSCLCGISGRYQKMATERGLAFACSFREPLPRQVEVDQPRLRRILSHLLDNALKFTEKGEVRLEAEVSPGWMRLSVADSGAGIPPDRLHTLFKPFQQNGDSVYANQGAGIGLALCHQLVKLLGGHIDATSRLGEGTRVTLHLPLRILDSGEHAPLPAEPPSASEQRLEKHSPTAGSSRLTPSQRDRLLDLAHRGRLLDLRTAISALGQEADPVITPLREAAERVDIKRIRQLLERFEGSLGAE